MVMSFESNVAFHCAPTLAGIKPSNLFTWRHTEKEDSKKHIAGLAEKFSGSGIDIQTLCECDRYSLILVYRGETLEKLINKPEVRDFLRGFGYPKEMGLRGCLEKLKTRFTPHDDFPHEIGIFLGYPLHDVTAFIHSPHRSCVLSGEWKVYENEKDACVLFKRFKQCRAELYARFLNGSDLAELVA